MNDPPVLLPLPAASVPENSPADTMVGAQITFTDSDVGDTGTFSLVPATHPVFRISTEGQVAVKTAALDFEATPTYTLTVRVMDRRGLSASTSLTIAVTNVNEAPVLLPLPAASVPENSPADTMVGAQITFTDSDVGDTGTFSLVPATHPVFRISAEGQVAVKTAALDFEATPTYTLTVRVMDRGGLSASTSLTIAVTNVNEAPVLLPANRSIPENSARGSPIGAPLTALDPDAGDTCTWTIASGAGGTISMGAGGQLVASSPLDFEATPSYTLTVTVMDLGGTGLSTSALIVVFVTNVNEAPTAAVLSNSAVAEGVAGAMVGEFTCADPDAGQTCNFTLAVNPGGQLFLSPAGQL